MMMWMMHVLRYWLIHDRGDLRNAGKISCKLLCFFFDWSWMTGKWISSFSSHCEHLMFNGGGGGGGGNVPSKQV